MTRAVCIGCGADKLGAFVRCFECGFDPSKPFDKVAMAKSLLLSDQYQDGAGLDTAGAVLGSGRELTWPQADVDRLAAKIEELFPGTQTGAAPPPEKQSVRIALSIAILILGIALAIAIALGLSA